MNDSLRFSHDKYFGRFSFEEFKKNSIELEKVIKASRNVDSSKILTCEDIDTYKWSNVSVFMDEVEKALKNRKEYSIPEFNEEIWNRAYDIQLTIKTPSRDDNFMVCLSHDKIENKRLFFYGQNLDEGIYKGITETFNKPGFLYKIGDGFHKPSEFSLFAALMSLSRI